MRRQMMLLALALCCALPQQAKAQGVIPIALQQVINANGRSVASAQRYHKNRLGQFRMVIR